MASGSALYGAPRPKSKSNAISLSSTSIHALSTEISLARSRLSSNSKSKSAPGRSRPSKTKSLFANSNKNVSKRAAKDLTDDDRSYGGKTSEQLGGGISERDLARSKKKLKEKAKLYESMKRGDFNDDNGEGLVDFDRKWAEHPSDEESDNGDNNVNEEDDGDEIVEYEDEFGRTRKGKKSFVEKEKRREASVKKAVEELAAKDAVPEGLIIGNTIQTSAFATANFSAVPTSSMLSSALPAEEEEETHYDASKEVRTKGVGFYQFSTNTKERAVEMEELVNERKRTAEERKIAEEKKKRRREEVEARREEVKRRRRVKVGENWLEGFMGELKVGGAGKEEGREEDRVV